MVPEQFSELGELGDGGQERGNIGGSEQVLSDEGSSGGSPVHSVNGRPPEGVLIGHIQLSDDECGGEVGGAGCVGGEVRSKNSF